jgi:hypothetical protein
MVGPKGVMRRTVAATGPPTCHGRSYVPCRTFSTRPVSTRKTPMPTRQSESTAHWPSSTTNCTEPAVETARATLDGRRSAGRSILPSPRAGQHRSSARVSRSAAPSRLVALQGRISATGATKRRTGARAIERIVHTGRNAQDLTARRPGRRDRRYRRQRRNRRCTRDKLGNWRGVHRQRNWSVLESVAPPHAY